MHHLSCLSVDKDYRNDNIYFYMVECDENMFKSYHESFIMSLTPLDFLEVKWLNSHFFMSYVDART